MIPSANAQITWNEASDIAIGQPIKALGIVEMRNAIDQLRSDVDNGTGGAWDAGSGSDIYFNGGDVGISISNPILSI